jgi:putative addiction module component (TIGR02574 family)
MTGLKGYFRHMPRTLEEVAKEALGLNPRQRLALAHFLLEANDAPDGDVDAAWEQEIEARIRALDEGRAKLIPYEQVRKG